MPGLLNLGLDDEQSVSRLVCHPTSILQGSPDFISLSTRVQEVGQAHAGPELSGTVSLGPEAFSGLTDEFLGPVFSAVGLDRTQVESGRVVLRVDGQYILKESGGLG
jgi:hypothetical protein